MNHSRPLERLTFIMFIGFFILFCNLIRMQVLNGKYYRSLSEKNRLRVIYLEAARGKIIDRNQEVLATSRLSFNCSAITREAKTSIEKSCQILSQVLGEEPEVLLNRFRKKKPGAFRSVLVAEDITQTQATQIEEKLLELPGFLIETRPQREYPYKESAAHVVGYIGPLTKGDASSREIYHYSLADWVGREGVERSYESYLRGYSGGLQIEVNNRGKIVRALGVKEPIEGKDIQLAVDAKLEKFIYERIGEQKAAAIVMDLKDGGILSLVSTPSFDPNLFASRAGRKKVGPYFSNPDSPMMNRAIRSQCPPGSIFKIVTAMAALASHKINPHTTSYNCIGYSMFGGTRFGCWKEGGHGPQILRDAFAHSCDVYFYNIGILAGIDYLAQKSIEFGFSKLSGIDLPGEQKGLLPNRDWKRERMKKSWFNGDTANLSIGQGFLLVTPVQALVMISAAATNGQIFRPHIVDKVDGVKVNDAPTKNMGLPATYWKSIKEGLDDVVNAQGGTGRLAKSDGVTVAGKTGTAQSGQEENHAWFAGYAPKDNPRVALVVFIENGGRGGVAAAGVASSIFGKLHELGYV